ncbi:hypothetical protein HHX47_DHR4001061 [Lentinula edodes]|nr:hypothetical protein HHX47_DHR4001061 [Lentinula edodes]
MLVISSIMVSRFLLDLREINETQVNGETTIMTTGTIAFATGTTTEPSQALLPPCRRGVSDKWKRGRFDDCSLFRDFMSDNGDDLCSYKDKTLVSEQPNESKHCSTEASEGKEV